MTISSRTPEGSPNCCPMCGQHFYIEPSRPFGDAPCPACGTLLWFVQVNDDFLLYDANTKDLIERVATRLGVSPSEFLSGQFGESGLESIEVVELIMELEDQSP
jgi:acyl carrier protein